MRKQPVKRMLERDFFFERTSNRASRESTRDGNGLPDLQGNIADSKGVNACTSEQQSEACHKVRGTANWVHRLHASNRPAEQFLDGPRGHPVKQIWWRADLQDDLLKGSIMEHLFQLPGSKGRSNTGSTQGFSTILNEQ